MKTINCLRDLEAYGIIPLTGEADALSYRVLCDVTHSGRQLICEAYGIKLEGFNEAWNSGTEKAPHVGSIMLGHDAWQQIGVIALVRSCRIVFGVHERIGFKRDGVNPNREVPVTSPDVSCLVGIESDETFEQAQWEYNETTGNVDMVKQAQINGMDWPMCYGDIGRYFAYGNGPREGSRNVHAMSGRAV